MIADRSYKTIDKSTWGDGPWQDEFDKIQWVDEATNLDCLIVRNRMGALCGYVGVPSEHLWHGKGYTATIDEGDDYHHCIDGLVDVHGGLTFSGFCDKGSIESEGICHVPLFGRSPDVYWFGFDCAHGGDIAPGMEARERERGYAPIRYEYEMYCTVGYVQHECAKLARQLLQVSSQG